MITFNDLQSIERKDSVLMDFHRPDEKKDWCKVVKANNDVEDGIRETASAMKRGLIKISTSMPEWRREVEGYVWDERVEEDKPVKENDHLMDATRYFVKTKKICKIRRSYDHLSGF